MDDDVVFGEYYDDSTGGEDNGCSHVSEAHLLHSLDCSHSESGTDGYDAGGDGRKWKAGAASFEELRNNMGVHGADVKIHENGMYFWCHVCTCG